MSHLKLKGRYYKAAPYENSTGCMIEELKLNIRETAFMVVDVYGRGHSEGEPMPKNPAFGTIKMHKIETEIIRNKIKPALDEARKLGLKIIYITNYCPTIAVKESEFGKYAARFHSYDVEKEFSSNREALKFSRIIAPRPDDFLVKKQMYDGFFDTNLDSLLKNLRIRNLIYVGFAANICLLTTMLGGFYRNYRTVLLRNCTLAWEYPDTVEGLRNTKESIRYTESFIGFTITSEEFIKACSSV